MRSTLLLASARKRAFRRKRWRLWGVRAEKRFTFLGLQRRRRKQWPERISPARVLRAFPFSHWSSSPHPRGKRRSVAERTAARSATLLLFPLGSRRLPVRASP